MKEIIKKQLFYTLGWITGMLLQLIIAPLIVDDFITKAWWKGQIIGYVIFSIIMFVIINYGVKINTLWVHLVSYLKRTNYNKYITNIFWKETWDKFKLWLNK